MMQKGVPQYLHLQFFPGLQIYASPAGGFKVFFFSHPNLGEMISNLTKIFFQMGWFNRQLVTLWQTNIAMENHHL